MSESLRNMISDHGFFGIIVAHNLDDILARLKRQKAETDAIYKSAHDQVANMNPTGGYRSVCLAYQVTNQWGTYKYGTYHPGPAICLSRANQPIYNAEQSVLLEQAERARDTTEALQVQIKQVESARTPR